jgi:6,7-dimethyl-8-ribityllumazine synthase
MATQFHNLSKYEETGMPDGSDMRFGIVVSAWNSTITDKLADGAKQTLLKHGVLPENIVLQSVPGSFELIYGASLMTKMEGPSAIDAVIALGCVIKGETPHFEYICAGVTEGLAALNAEGRKPVIYGLITAYTLQQAIDRSGGIHGNKGDEAAYTALKMVAFTRSLKNLPY